MNIPICFATNNNYAPHAAALIVSVMDNKSPDDEITFFCFGDQLARETKETFKAMSSQLGFTLHFFEVNDELLKDAPDFHGGKTAYFRLLIPRLLPETLTKILYLDCDMIVMDSLAELFATDISDQYAAVVGEALKMPHFPICSPFDKSMYFNSGMLLLNTEKYRQDNIEKKAFEFIKEHPEWIQFGDQDVFNAVFAGRVVDVPLRWNVIAHLYVSYFPLVNYLTFPAIGWRLPKRFWRQLRQAERNPGIVHFTNTKPWDGGCNAPLRKLYWNYVKKTPFYESVRFSWRRVRRNILNVFLLGHLPALDYLLMVRKK
ncbi:MAG: glycosyltransferase family 8 protein [Planctomycetaceae bacterium]|jgi:lipopolysaccharide biosynthesis glycosyltransferase|nr:glycosyltransferase family 8 protein [Planctomycetaceae bacterium]